MRQKIIALIGLGLGLLIIAGIALALFSFAAGLVLALEEVLFGRAGGSSIPGTRLLRSVGGAETTKTNFALGVSVLVYGALSAAVLIEARLRGRADWRDIVAWHSWRLDRRVLAIAGIALAYGFLADLALRYLHPQSGSWLTMPADPVGALVLGFIAVVCAPLAEEILFRGWVYTDLRRNFGFATTLVATSAVFAWLHYESTHLYALAVFPIGLALGTMREITGSVKPAIVFHAVNNFLASALSYLGV